MYDEIPYTGLSTSSFKQKLCRISGQVRPDLDVRFYTKPRPSVQTYFNIKDPIPKHLQADVVYSVICIDCGHTYVGKTIRQPIRRFKEHGAPDLIFQQQNTHSDTNGNNMNHTEQPPVQQAIHNNIKTTTRPIQNRHRARQTPYPEPTNIRRSARIQAQRVNSRNDKNTNNNPRNPNINQKTSTIKSSIAEHQKQTGHHMDWEGFKIVYHETHKQKLLLKESLVIKAYNTSLNKTTHSFPLILFPEGIQPNNIPNPTTFDQQH
jgi:hypothetical protein